MPNEKMRLDMAMVSKKLANSRERAKALITAGLVSVNGVKTEKSALLVSDEDAITIKGSDIPYVSRGGLKLEKAMASFPIFLSGKVCADIGASTGGFTDCMLQKGAVKVYAIDVGYGQLAWKLRQDERVVNLERTNIRYVTEEQISEKMDFCSIDVSFISLRQVLPVAWNLLKMRGELVALIKPQFEAGREKVGKKGVVRDAKVHEEVILTVSNFAAKEKFRLKGLTYSPVRGPEGNIEYLLFLEKSDQVEEPFEENQILEVVNSSHQQL